MGRRKRVEPLAEFLPDWQRHLRAAGRSERTVTIYTGAAQALLRHLRPGTSPSQVTHRDINRFTESLRTRGLSPSYVNQHYRSLQQWFRWLTEVEQEISESPFARLSPPSVPELLTDILTDDDLIALLAACRGRSFFDRRDTALIRVLLDTGCRRGELLGMKTGDIDSQLDTIAVIGKGRRPRIVPYGNRTGEALNRYLRSRRGHRVAKKTDHLWLSGHGPLGDNGLRALLRRRGEIAGVHNVHPHRFRHTFAHRWLADGGTEGDLMRLTGWRSRAMVDRYGAIAANDRAVESHRRRALGDRF